MRWYPGIYAGDARRLSRQECCPQLQKMEIEHGSLFRGLLRMANGRARRSSRPGRHAGADDALSRALGTRAGLRTPVLGLSDLGRRGFRVPLESGARSTWTRRGRLPAWESARILGQARRRLGAALAAIPSVPLAVVHVASGVTRSARCPQASAPRAARTGAADARRAVGLSDLRGSARRAGAS